MKGVNDDGGDMGSWVRFAVVSWIVSMLSTSSSISSGNYTSVSYGRSHAHIILHRYQYHCPIWLVDDLLESALGYF